MDIKYKVNSEVSAKELIEVFKSVGWNKAEEDICEAFMRNAALSTMIVQCGYQRNRKLSSSVVGF